MKKTLLSILAGIIVAGTAFAVPSPDMRKKACEQQSDKVWVEKGSGACIDVNPCLSDDGDVKKAYCLSFGNDTTFYSGGRAGLEMLGRKYAEMVLKVGVDLIMEISENAIGLKTSDGGYFAVLGRGITENDSLDNACQWVMEDVVNAHGYSGSYKGGLVESESMSVSVTSSYGLNSGVCETIKDFATDLIDQQTRTSQFQNANAWMFDAKVTSEYDPNASHCNLKCTATLLP